MYTNPLINCCFQCRYCRFHFFKTRAYKEVLHNIIPYYCSAKCAQDDKKECLNIIYRQNTSIL